MKKLKNNKGFTLIELLAVIVILAILVAVAVPAVTRYLNTARKGTFASNAQAAISVVRNDVISKSITTNSVYSLTCVNKMLEKQLKNSPYGKEYAGTSFVAVTFDATTGESTYSICLTDGQNGYYATGRGVDEEDVIEANVKTDATTACSKPNGYTEVTVQ